QSRVEAEHHHRVEPVAVRGQPVHAEVDGDLEGIGARGAHEVGYAFELLGVQFAEALHDAGDQGVTGEVDIRRRTHRQCGRCIDCPVAEPADSVVGESCDRGLGDGATAT